ncbi:hypothetical protein GJ688_13235 [Heliobacillus mobilis]|uniref:Uncharacterized protein n=1 Tax=Heliobacterium mobile TaxID=28064 RepID=A0A6I3SLV5_HELMO|nr:hypothetical protein [Heliobacterium mobile]MTV49938.1 hypothetical protein [Heliobacterium mobile]
MRIWIDDEYVGEAAKPVDISSIVEVWTNRQPTRIITGFEHAGQYMEYGEQWDLFLNENAVGLEDVDVRLFTSSREEVLLELAESVKEYLERLVVGVPRLADQFYGDASADTWKEMENLSEGLSFLDSSAKLLGMGNYDQGRFFDLLGELEQAMRNRDTIFIGDLLKYELTPWLEGIRKSFVEN